MQLKELLTEDRAVSPVIGVILMVAITVILAAVIGTFVLGLGDSVQQTTPQATFSFDYDESGTEAQVVVTHDGGDRIAGDRLNSSVDGSTVGTGDYAYDNPANGWNSHDNVNAGTSVTINKTTSGEWSGETIRVIWTSQDRSSSSTIGRSTAPS